MGNSWSSSKHSLTSQVTPSERPHSLTKRKLLLKPGRRGGTGTYYMVQKDGRQGGRRVVCGWLTDTKIWTLDPLLIFLASCFPLSLLNIES